MNFTIDEAKGYIMNRDVKGVRQRERGGRKP